MDKEKLLQSFLSLDKTDEGSNTYNVVSLDGLHHKLGKTYEGYPMFFIKTDNSDKTPANILRDILSVRYDERCAFHTDDACVEDNYVAVLLRSTDLSLQETFVDIVYLMIKKLQPVPTNTELATEVEKLITIFSALTKEPVKKIQGLWGELFLIERSLFPETLIDAWHSSPTAKYDFTLGRDKIEVKTTSSENRVHHFSLDQLNPSANSRLLIASICVRESGRGNGGMTIKELLDSINAKVVSVNEQIRLLEIMAKTIGKDYSKMNNISFDYTEALDSLRFYRPQDVPHIDKCNIPAAVSEVKFTSDLTDVPDILSSNMIDEFKNSDLFISTLK